MPRRKKGKITDDKDNLESKADHFACPHCTSLLSSYKNLQRHIREVHSIETTPMICVDLVNGLYVTPKHDHSPVFPIYVVKSINPPKIDCEMEGCCRFMQIACSSGNPGKECIHLERTKHAKRYMNPAVLKLDSLKDMLCKGLMSSDWGEKCKAMDIAAINNNIDSVFPVLERKPSTVGFFPSSQMKLTAGANLEGQELYLIHWLENGTVNVKEVENLTVVFTV